jgi:spore maturation protein CgeB
MKVLYVSHGHFWDSTWPYAYIDNYLVATLKNMGCEVKVYDFFSRAFIFHEILRGQPQIAALGKQRYLEFLEERASAELPLEVLEFEPDFILHIVGRLGSRCLKALKKLKIPTAIWFLDDPQELKATTRKALLYDYVFTVEPAAVEAYRAAGVKSVRYLPLACFSEIQKPLKNLPEEYHSDICFVGVPFPNRVALFDKLADFFKEYKVRIIGGGQTVGGDEKAGWLWEKFLTRMDVYQGSVIDRMIPPEEAAKYYNGARINLNIHRTSADQRFEREAHLGIEASGVNGRTFEIAGCSAFQIVDASRNVGDFFEVGKEITIYKNENDLVEKIKYFLSHEKERLKIAASAYQKVIDNHTYQHRLQQIIDCLSSDFLTF